MGKGSGWDLARQAANVVGVIFQVVAPIFTAAAVGEVSDQNSTLVVPAGYAFVIWTPIFFLAFVYAVYQALPSKRRDPLLRGIGWFSAVAFISNGIWQLLFPARQFVLSQLVFVVIFACAGLAYLAVQRASQSDGRVRRWLLAPGFGLFFGWVTAAILVGFATVLTGIGLLEGGWGEAVLGAGLLLLGGAIACAVVLATRQGPPQGYLSYAAAVVWALVAVVVNQYGASLLTTGAAAISAVVVVAVVALALLRPRRGRTPPAPGDGHPRVV